jgi:hypothetical protein
MQADLHNAMRHIIDKALVGEASAQEQQSLREHLRACAQCERYADDGRRAIAGLSGFSFGPFAGDPGLQAKVRAALDLRAQQLEAAQPGRRRIARTCIIALLLTAVGSLAAFQIGGPLAGLLSLRPSQAQAGLLALWILPSLCFSLFLPVLLLLSARSAKTKGSVL